MVKVRGNAGNAVPGPLKLLASVPRPHTAVNGTNRLRGPRPSAYSRAPNFFSVPGPPNLYFGKHLDGAEEAC